MITAIFSIVFFIIKLEITSGLDLNRKFFTYLVNKQL